MNTNARAHGCWAGGVLIASLALTAGLGEAFAQDPPPAPLHIIPDNGVPLRIERIADIPARLTAALLRENCPINDALMSTFPVEIFRPSPVSKLIATVA